MNDYRVTTSIDERGPKSRVGQWAAALLALASLTTLAQAKTKPANPAAAEVKAAGQLNGNADGGPSSGGAFLASAWKDAAVVLRAENARRSRESSINNPIEKLQLRLNQNEYIEDRKAILRASPRGWNEFRLMRQLNSKTAHLEDMAYRQELTKALAERYLALVEYRFSFERRRIENAINESTQRALGMQNTSANSSKSSAHDLLRAREAFENSRFKASEADAKVRRDSERMKSLDPSVQVESVGYGDWPAPGELVAIADRLGGGDRDPKNLETQLAREHADRMRDSVEYDTQRDTKLIDYLEISYSEKGSQESRYGFEIGINVPGFSGKDFGNKEKARQLVRYEIEAHEKDREQRLKLSSSRELLERAVEAYKSLTSAEDAATTNRIRALARSTDPLLANAIDREAFDREMRASESAREAYVAYIELLRASGTLDEKAQTNFLSRGLKELAP